MPNLNLDELERIARAATPGPWKSDAEVLWWHGGDNQECIVRYHRGNSIYSPIACVPLHGGGRWGHGGTPNPIECAAHIATFDPPTVLALIARIRELEAPPCPTAPPAGP